MNNPLELQFTFSSSDHLNSLPLRRRLRRLLTPSREEIVKRALARCQPHVVWALAVGPIYFSEEQGFSGAGFDALPAHIGKKLTVWSTRYREALTTYQHQRIKKSLADYEDYSLGVVGGMVIGLVLGWIADQVGLTGIPAVEGIVRFIAGSGDSLGGMVVVTYARMRGRHSKAELFAVGTIVGMMAGPALQILTVFLGFNPYGLAGSVYAIAYSMADNIGGLIAALVGLVRRQHLVLAIKTLVGNPFLASTMVVVALFSVLDLVARSIGGFSPITNVLAAVEAVALNAAFIIPIVVVWGYGLWLRRPLLKTLQDIK